MLGDFRATHTAALFNGWVSSLIYAGFRRGALGVRYIFQGKNLVGLLLCLEFCPEVSHAVGLTLLTKRFLVIQARRSLG